MSRLSKLLMAYARAPRAPMRLYGAMADQQRSNPTRLLSIYLYPARPFRGAMAQHDRPEKSQAAKVS